MKSPDPMNGTQAQSVEAARTDLINRGTSLIDLELLDSVDKTLMAINPPRMQEIVTQTEGACYASSE